MKAIILAAGRGGRLYPYTHDKPKCLLDIGNISILEHQINLLDKFMIGINLGTGHELYLERVPKRSMDNQSIFGR